MAGLAVTMKKRCQWPSPLLAALICATSVSKIAVVDGHYMRPGSMSGRSGRLSFITPAAPLGGQTTHIKTSNVPPTRYARRAQAWVRQAASVAGDGAQAEQDPNSIESVSREVLGLLCEVRHGSGGGGLREVLGTQGALGITWVDGGSTNYCFSVFNEEAPQSQRVFVKLARDFVRGFDEWAQLPRHRVWYEKEGFLHLDKHWPGVTPRVLLVDSAKGILVAEYLMDYVPYALSLEHGLTLDPAPSLLASLAAQCHVSSMAPHHCGKEREELLQAYANHEHVAFWNKCFFTPLQETLLDPHCVHASRPFLAPLITALNRHRQLSDAVASLHAVYAHKKHALVHADLHCNNVLIKRDTSATTTVSATVNAEGSCKKESWLRIIDAEKFYYGPAGMDVGQLLANYAWYLAVADGPSGAPSPRQAHSPSLCSALATCWDSYASAFLQAGGSRTVLGEVLRDGVGLLGLWVLFLCVACPVQIMTVPGHPHQTLHIHAFQRLVAMAAACMRWYDNCDSAIDKTSGEIMSGQQLVELLRTGYRTPIDT